MAYYGKKENMRRKMRQKKIRERLKPPTMAVRPALKQPEEKHSEGPR